MELAALNNIAQTMDGELTFTVFALIVSCISLAVAIVQARRS